MNSEICVFVSTYPYNISVLFHTFLVAFGKVTDSQSFKYKEYSVKGAHFCEEYSLIGQYGKQEYNRVSYADNYHIYMYMLRIKRHEGKLHENYEECFLKESSYPIYCLFRTNRMTLKSYCLT